MRTASGWTQLDPATLTERPAPDEAQVRALIEDAFTANPSRYGHIARLDGTTVTTDTGVRVTLNWPRLALSQRGPDTQALPPAPMALRISYGPTRVPEASAMTRRHLTATVSELWLIRSRAV